MRVRYTPRAGGELSAILQYIDERSPRGARNVKRAIARAIRLLASRPNIAPLTDESSVRELNVPRRPYKIYYRIEDQEVWIVNIRDARRRPLKGKD